VKHIKKSTQIPKSKPNFSNPLLSVNLSRDFKYLWLGQGGQGFAMWSEMIARNWLTYQLTGSAQAIGIVNLFRAIPFVTVGMFGGVIADRFPKNNDAIINFKRSNPIMAYLCHSILPRIRNGDKPTSSYIFHTSNDR